MLGKVFLKPNEKQIKEAYLKSVDIINTTQSLKEFKKNKIYLKHINKIFLKMKKYKLANRLLEMQYYKVGELKE